MSVEAEDEEIQDEQANLQEEILIQLKLLNARFEAEHQTGIDEEDLDHAIVRS